MMSVKIKIKRSDILKELIIYKKYNCLVFNYYNHYVSHEVDGELLDLLDTVDLKDGIVECIVILKDRICTVKVDIRSLFAKDGLDESLLDEVEVITCMDREKHIEISKLYTEDLEALRELRKVAL